MAKTNLWIDELTRDRGTYRHIVGHNIEECAYTSAQFCNNNDMEDALIEALDAGFSAEEIADIQLGAIS